MNRHFYFCLFVFFVFISMSVLAGCGGGGGSDGDGDGSPDPGTEGCTNCPCDFFSVPMTAGCWVLDSDGPTFFPFPPPPSSGFESCDLRRNDTFEHVISVVRLDAFGELGMSCLINALESDTCPAPDLFRFSLTQDQLADCRTCLEEYATELNDAGITVTGGPPYTCDTDSSSYTAPPLSSLV